jgi:hypothetical protein
MAPQNGGKPHMQMPPGWTGGIAETRNIQPEHPTQKRLTPQALSHAYLYGVEFDCGVLA